MKPIICCCALLLTLSTLAGDAHSASPYSSKQATGTGSKTSSSAVRGHVTKQGTYVAPYRKSTPDSTKANNWSTKGNVNPINGKRGRS